MCELVRINTYKNVKILKVTAENSCTIHTDKKFELNLEITLRSRISLSINDIYLLFDSSGIQFQIQILYCILQLHVWICLFASTTAVVFSKSLCLIVA